MQPSTQDFVPPFDPTAFAQITGAQLYQLIAGAAPNGDEGIVLITTDAASVAQVPDAVTNPKWTRYIWIRISPQTDSIAMYVWNPNGVSDPSFLNWVPAFPSVIPNGTITGAQIASNTITADKIVTVDISQITNAPSSLPPSGAAGGDLNGTYPNPLLNDGSVSTSKIQQNAVNGGAAGKLATGADGATLANNIAMTASSTFATPSGGNAGAPVSNDRVVVNAAGTAFVTIRKVLDSLVEPAGGDALKVLQVNNSGNGFQYAGTYAKSIVDNVALPVAGATSAIAHLLAGVPASVRVVLRCISNDAATAYVVNDEIDAVCAFQDTSHNMLFSLSIGAVNVSVLRAAAGNLELRKKGDGTATTATSEANFVLKVYSVYFN